MSYRPKIKTTESGNLVDLPLDADTLNGEKKAEIIKGLAKQTDVDNALAGKQDSTDNSLATTNKTIVGAINELNNGKASKSTTLAGYGITNADTSSEVDTKIANATKNKANKATTLSGYGITDAYTKTEVNTELDKKVSSKKGFYLIENPSRLENINMNNYNTTGFFTFGSSCSNKPTKNTVIGLVSAQNTGGGNAAEVVFDLAKGVPFTRVNQDSGNINKWSPWKSIPAFIKIYDKDDPDNDLGKPEGLAIGDYMVSSWIRQCFENYPFIIAETTNGWGILSYYKSGSTYFMSCIASAGLAGSGFRGNLKVMTFRLQGDRFDFGGCRKWTLDNNNAIYGYDGPGEEALIGLYACVINGGVAK